MLVGSVIIGSVGRWVGGRLVGGSSVSGRWSVGQWSVGLWSLDLIKPKIFTRSFSKPIQNQKFVCVKSLGVMQRS